MKKILLIAVVCLCCSCCGVKQSAEEDAKGLSDARALNIILIDSVTVLNHVKDSLEVVIKDCKADNKQLEHWLRKE